MATLCYDLIDQKRAYTEFLSSLQLINTPGMNYLVNSQKSALAGRYEAMFTDIPPVAQSVNYVTYALRESVIQVLDNVEDEKVEVEDNTIDDIIEDALQGLDIGQVEEQPETVVDNLQASNDENLFYKK